MATKDKDTKMLQIKLVKSRYGRIPSHRLTIASLGLRKINQTVVLRKTPAVMGMVKKVNYLLEVSEK